MRLSEIKINPKNPRIIKDGKFNRLKKSIQEFPKMMELRPMVIDNDNMVLGGNMRLKALEDLKYDEIPDNWIKKASELSEEEIRKFIILDNASFGEWDWDELANEYEVEELKDWGVEVPNFFGQNEAVEDDYEIPDEIETDIVLGDLFEIGNHRLLCGDSTNSGDVVRLMNGSKADILHCDPPYGVNYADKNEFLNQQDKGNRIQRPYASDKEEDYVAWFNSWLKLAPLSNYNSIYIWINEPKLFELLTTMRLCEIKMSSLLIWVKNNHVLSRKDYHPKYEICLFGWKGKHKFYGDFNTSILEYDKPLKNELHPTMKPVAMIAKLINNSTKIEQIVLELFLGSGTTMVAAHQLNRKCYGMEIDPTYCQVIIDRMLKLDPSLEIKKNGQPYVQKEVENNVLTT